MTTHDASTTFTASSPTTDRRSVKVAPEGCVPNTTVLRTSALGSYTITQYTRSQAKRLGVTVKHAKNPTKKLDVFKDGEKIATCGAMGYNDYPTFMKKFGKEIADKHRVQYKRRHEKDRHVVGSPGYYADQLLW